MGEGLRDTRRGRDKNLSRPPSPLLGPEKDKTFPVVKISVSMGACTYCGKGGRRGYIRKHERSETLQIEEGGTGRGEGGWTRVTGVEEVRPLFSTVDRERPTPRGRSERVVASGGRRKGGVPRLDG